MAYKFQLGTARLSGSVIAEGDLTAESSTISGTTVQVPVGGLELDGAAVNASAAEINVLDSVTAGTAAASKAVVLDSNKDISGVRNITIEGSILGGAGAQAIGSSGSPFENGWFDTLSASVGMYVPSEGLYINNVKVSASAAELNYLDNVVAGTAAASKAVVLDASKDISGVRNITIEGSILGGSGTQAIGASGAAFEQGWFETLNASTALTASALDISDVSGIAGVALVNNNGVLDVSGVTNAEIDANAAIAFSKLAALSAGNILVGNASNVAASVAMSGHVAIDNTGATTIQNSTITSAMVSGTLSADKLNFNANQFSSSAGQLNLKPTISGSLTFSNDITVNGNFTVLGDTFSASVGTLLVEDALINIGDGTTSEANGYGIEFGTSGSSWGHFKTDDSLGAMALSSSFHLVAPSFVSADWQITDSHISGNLPVSASAFYGDGANLTNVSATGIRLAQTTLSNTGNIVAKLTILDPANTGVTGTLPDLTSVQAGEMYVIKDAKGLCSTKPVMIKASGSQKIDEVASVTLESDFAAITIFSYNDGGTNKWIIV